MKRRGFLGAVAGLVAAPLMPSAPPIAPVVTPPSPPAAPMVRKAHWSTTNGILVGVAMETVHIGDFVQIQTFGPASVNVQR